MTEKTLGGFCRDLLDDQNPGNSLDPEQMAARFVDHFGLSTRPTLEELTALAERAGFGTVQEGKMDGLRGAHLGQREASTTSTTGTTCGKVQRPRPCYMKCTRSSWSGWTKSTPQECPYLGAEPRDLPAGGTLRGGGAFATRHLPPLRLRQRAGRGDPSTMSLAAPTPRRPFGWPRW